MNAIVTGDLETDEANAGASYGKAYYPAYYRQKRQVLEIFTLKQVFGRPDKSNDYILFFQTFGDKYPTMYKQLFLIFCATSLFGCISQKEFDFEVNVEHWYGQTPINRLFVTKRSGEIVKVFENPAETYKLKETIPYVASDPENATLDFHWIFGDELGDKCLCSRV